MIEVGLIIMDSCGMTRNDEMMKLCHKSSPNYEILQSSISLHIFTQSYSNSIPHDLCTLRDSLLVLEQV